MNVLEHVPESDRQAIQQLIARGYRVAKISRRKGRFTYTVTKESQP